MKNYLVVDDDSFHLSFEFINSVKEVDSVTIPNSFSDCFI